MVRLLGVSCPFSPGFNRSQDGRGAESLLFTWLFIRRAHSDRIRVKGDEYYIKRGIFSHSLESGQTSPSWSYSLSLGQREAAGTRTMARWIALAESFTMVFRWALQLIWVSSYERFSFFGTFFLTARSSSIESTAAKFLQLRDS